jgi:HK97 family phage prohead protease
MNLTKQYAIQVLKEFEDGSSEIVITTESVDRDGEVIEVDGWQLENYLANPVVLYAHDYRSVPIGRTLELRREPGQLVARFEFRQAANDADPINQIRAAWNQGILRAASVGFRPLEWRAMDDDDGTASDEWYWGPKRYTRAELLEWSIVPIPANQEALRRAFEAYVKSLQPGIPPVPEEQRATPPTNPADTQLPAWGADLLRAYIDWLKAYTEVMK